MSVSWIDAFLNVYGDRVNAVGRCRTVNSRKASKARQELSEVVREVRSEVRRLRADLKPSIENQVKELYVITHIETYLPVVYCKLQALPMLVVHVGRDYATCRKFIHGLGFRQEEYCGGKLTGRVCRAASYVYSSCRKLKWQLSVSEALNIWITAALDIPLKDRYAAMAVKKSYFDDSFQVEKKSSAGKANAEALSSAPFHNNSHPVIGSDAMETSEVSDPSPEKAARGNGASAGLKAVENTGSRAPKSKKRHTVSASEEDNSPPRRASPSHRLTKCPRVAAPPPQLDLAPSSSAELRASVVAALDKQEDVRAKRLKASTEKDATTVKFIVSAPRASSSAGIIESSVPSPKVTLPPTTAAQIPDNFSQFSTEVPSSIFPNFDNIDISTEGINLKMEPQEFFRGSEEVIASGGGTDYLLPSLPVEGVTSCDPSVSVGREAVQDGEEIVATGGGDGMANSELIRGGDLNVKREIAEAEFLAAEENEILSLKDESRAAGKKRRKSAGGHDDHASGGSVRARERTGNVAI